MSIFVTGGTGFLGSYVIRRLLAEGYTDIMALRRKNSNMDLTFDFKDRVQWLEGELNDPQSLEEGIHGKKWVFHIAAVVSFQTKDRKKLHDANVKGTAAIVNACLDHGVEKLLHVSSISAVGRTKPIQILNEKNIFQTSPYNTEYGISKFWSEQEVWRGIAEGLNAAIVNPSVILGAGRWYEGSGLFFDNLYKGFRFIPSGKISLVDVRDVARILVQLAKSDISEERFIVNAGDVSFYEFFSAIAQQLNVPAPKYKITPFMREAAWRLAVAQGLLLGREPQITKENIRQSALEYVFENQKSRDMLQFEYTPLAQTIAETSAAYLQSGGKTLVF